MSKNGVQWDKASFERMKAAMRDYENVVRREVERYANEKAIEMENWAKEERNHPWDNQTHLAEKGLRGFVEKKDGHFRIIITHSVSYGLELETMAGGRWGVIWPTIQHIMPIIQSDMAALKKRL